MKNTSMAAYFYVKFGTLPISDIENSFKNAVTKLLLKNCMKQWFV